MKRAAPHPPRGPAMRASKAARFFFALPETGRLPDCFVFKPGHSCAIYPSQLVVAGMLVISLELKGRQEGGD